MTFEAKGPQITAQALILHILPPGGSGPCDASSNPEGKAQEVRIAKRCVLLITNLHSTLSTLASTGAKHEWFAECMAGACGEWEDDMWVSLLLTVKYTPELNASMIKISAR